MFKNNIELSFYLSSTIVDLVEERNEIKELFKSIGISFISLENQPMPVSATSKSILDEVRSNITQCDYFILIAGGRYGSIINGQKSYTESEYDYALLKKKSIIAFLKDVDESELDIQQVAFRERVIKDNVVVYYHQAHELSEYMLKCILHLPQVKQAIEETVDSTFDIKEKVDKLAKQEVSISFLQRTQKLTEITDIARLLGLSNNNSDQSNQEILKVIADELRKRNEKLDKIYELLEAMPTREGFLSKIFWELIIPVIAGIIIAMIIAYLAL